MAEMVIKMAHRLELDVGPKRSHRQLRYLIHVLDPKLGRIELYRDLVEELKGRKNNVEISCLGVEGALQRP